MGAVWYALLAALLAGYVLLDGYDLGAGVVHFLVGKSERERGAALRTIAPLWDGNEVWLLAAGGTLVMAFPAAYAASFSGFYLPLTIVLWLLIGRACAIEFRRKVDDPAWRGFWDRIYAVSSVLLVVAFGAALGNVVRGVPFDADGRFFEPLFTHFGVTGDTGILDWYTVGVGLAALAAVALHGSLWLSRAADGELAARARRLSRRLFLATCATTLLVTAGSLHVQPHVLARYGEHPAGFALPFLAVAGLAGVGRFAGRGGDRDDRRAFLASCLYLVGMLASVAFGQFPYVLASNGDAARGLTVWNAAAPDHLLRAALWWWIPGMALAVGYSAFVHRRFRGRVKTTDAEPDDGPAPAGP
jgi:cytochrome d ubiquinol oxidase subunit II